MFVDIGTKRDGLVHVKDISKDYFINNHQSVIATILRRVLENLSNLLLSNYLFQLLLKNQKFIAGQDIDVWVKFVEEETSKLGLQMFPVLGNKKQYKRSR